MAPKVEWSTPPDTMEPVGPYSHIAKAGPFISIGATAGVDPATGELAGPDVASQSGQILDAFATMLSSVGASLDDVMHIHVFLADMGDCEAMNVVYAEKMGARRPARMAIAVSGLPKAGAVVTMNLTAFSSREVA
jgi:2-iminobutanoate/2-iminopropanoate deaminase